MTQRALLTVAILALVATHAHAASYSLSMGLANPNSSPQNFGIVVHQFGGQPLVSASDAGGGARVYLFSDTGNLLRTFANPVATAGEYLGAAAQTFGGNLALGAPGDGVGMQVGGAVYVFNASSGALLQTINNPEPAADAFFGAAMTVAGGNLVVGAWGEASAGPNTGKVYVFDGSGTLLLSLTAPTPTANTYFGDSLATLGSNIVVGAIGEAYLFDGATGALLQTFANPVVGDTLFGDDVAVLGTKVVVGAPLDDTAASNAGAIYVFDGASGTLLDTILPPTATPSQFMAAVVEVVDGKILANSPSSGGHVHVFDASGTHVQTIDNPDSAGQVQFGNSIAGIGTSVLVGAPTPAGPEGGLGEAFVFDLCGDGVQAPAEACDDGNVASGDGCSATCRLEACPPTPSSACRPARARSPLVLASSSGGKLSWVWRSASTQAEPSFGDPLATTSYFACLYDGSASPQPLLSPDAPAGVPWAALGTDDFRYRSLDFMPSGVRVVKLLRLARRQSKIVLKANGPLLGTPPFPLALPVVMQMRNTETPTCWSASYGTGSSTATAFRGRSD